jgi:hypothetical protein
MACPICFGGEDAATRESLNAGIGVLLGVTAIVLALFARFIAQLARRSRESAHLVTDLTWGRASSPTEPSSSTSAPSTGASQS